MSRSLPAPSSVTSQRSAPAARFCVAIARDSRWPSGRLVVIIAISMFSTRSKNFSSSDVMGSVRGWCRPVSRPAPGCLLGHLFTVAQIPHVVMRLPHLGRLRLDDGERRSRQSGFQRLLVLILGDVF